MKLRQIDPATLKGKKVLVRVDFNVPLKDGRITDNTRITAHKDTIELLKKNSAKVALVTHLGRPKGKTVDSLSTKQLIPEIEAQFGMKTKFVRDIDEISREMDSLDPGELLILENIRFYPEEKKNDRDFAKKLAAPFDIFVMDAFSAAHRAHASTVAVQHELPSFAGLLLKKEIEMLGKVKKDPEKPFAIILGGAKVSDKIGVIESLLEKADSILIGGGMAFTFLKASGLETGTSLVEEESLNFAVKMLGKARSSGVSIVLPEDVKIGTSPEDKEGRTVKASSIPSDRMGLDIGPDTVKLFKKVIKGSRTVLWNGPLGVFENPVFAEGTKEIAAYIAERTDNKELFSVIGGGDSAAAVKKFKYETRMSHVSTGGGASLEFFEKEILPGVEPLSVDE